MTTKQIINYSEKVFNELAASNIITLQQRKDVVVNYVMEQFKDETIALIESIRTNEIPCIIFEDNNYMKGILASASYRDNRVYVNLDMMQIYLNTDFQSCYKKEYQFIKRNVKTKKDAIAWTVCHEFAHTLILEKRPHNLQFFQLVEKLYQNLKR